MRPDTLNTKIFLDGGDPAETRQIIDLLGFLDGQTTNPTLISKNPDAKKRLEQGRKFTEKDILDFYRNVVGEISGMMPTGSVSVEVYSDLTTSAEEMCQQARTMNSWIPNAHIKFPTSPEGLRAAETMIKEGVRVNMTLCFTQEQAAAVHAATRDAALGDVFVSPFIGRLDDRGENGMDLIGNIIRMYGQAADRHVEVLTASVRTMEHFLCALKLESDIITAPYKILKQWGDMDMPVPGMDFEYDAGDLAPIPYRNIALDGEWEAYDIHHDLTVKGMESFSKDWNALIE